MSSWRAKETDCIAMATELRKLGTTVEEGRDYLGIILALLQSNVAVDTYAITGWR